MRPSLLSALLTGSLLLGSIGSLYAAEQTYNQVALRAEVQRAVNHDLLRVRLYAEDQDDDAAELANRITTRLNAALAVARGHEGVRVSSGSRNSHPVYDDKGQSITAWRERGEIILESNDFATLSNLTGELLGQLSLNDMQFSLSAASRRTTEDELIREAIEAFKARADIASQSLGGNGYKIVSLNLNSQFMPPPMLRQRMSTMSADMEMATPSVEGGQADVSVSADGIIEVLMP
ncbi:MAG: hypothetical protein CVV07_05440 [Gammaproteobacteria bacterium HGW-Gammaproteobacteria-11]|nr:MAG: hypothetical protein CVV07_05440 [Gammaproteobacteria bacterium HGW-Gammaproteobacteria-11]